MIFTASDNKKYNKPASVHATFIGHLRIARLDHWFKNIFVLPGIVVALSADPSKANFKLIFNSLTGLLSICIIASSNYVINEVLDAPFDCTHPIKCNRPVPSGIVSIPVAYAQWILLMLLGIGLALTVSAPFTVTMFVLWIMGCIYNIPPIRSKDKPYLDVLSEAVNNPLRMLAGWFIVGPALIPPLSMLLSYWMIGCYLMAIKRYAELKEIGCANRATAYRKSFGFYTEQRLLVSIVFYASCAMLFFGAFIMRYRLELILSFPLIALLMAVYLLLAFKENSPVQNPEGLYREPLLMVIVIMTSLFMMALFFTDMPVLHTFFSPTIPVN